MPINTTLPKSGEFMRQLNEFLLTPDAQDYCVAAIDIEHFKLFNEWYGWEAGDQVLEMFADHIQQYHTLEKGFAGYLGNDDFVMVLPNDSVLLYDIRRRAQNLIAGAGRDVSFNLRMGVCSIAEQPQANAPDLCNYAQIASTLSKGVLGRVGRFNRSQLDRAKIQAQMVNNLEKALSAHEFTFYLQPQCNSKTRVIVGMEALARWERPNACMISPAEFVPLMEDSGLVVELDCYLWEQVCRMLSEWKEQGRNLVPVSINVSMADIESIDVAQHLSYLVDDFGFEPNLLHVEITESMVAQNYEVVSALVRDLHQRGFAVYMDDFGSGFSSLNMLKDINIDVIKLDMKLIDLNSQNYEKGERIVESVINMAHQLEIPLVAEGVETPEQVRMLQEMDCPYMQGYKFYRPMPRSHAEVLLEQPDAAAFWDMASDMKESVVPDAQQSRKHWAIAGHASQILADAFLVYARVNFETGNFELIKYDSQLPPFDTEGDGVTGNLKAYANEMLRIGAIHPDYVRDFTFRTDPERLRTLMYSGEKIRSFVVLTTYPDKAEWVSIAVAACKGCGPQNPWGALFVLRESMESLPALTQKRFYETDSLTGLFNRGRYKSDVVDLQMADCDRITCVYVDAIGLHELNNHLGHAKGDLMLKSIGKALQECFADGFTYRIGGDEFVVLAPNMTAVEAQHAAGQARDLLGMDDIAISVGIAQTNNPQELPAIIEAAETAMRVDKQKFYASDAEGRQLRMLNEQLENMLVEKQDAERFLEMVVSENTSVYVVDLAKDKGRCVRAPQHIREFQHRGADGFKEAVTYYCERDMAPQYQRLVAEVLDYDSLRQQLHEHRQVARYLTCYNGNRFLMIITPYSEKPEDHDLTIWVFSPVNTQDGNPLSEVALS